MRGGVTLAESKSARPDPRWRNSGGQQQGEDAVSHRRTRVVTFRSCLFFVAKVGYRQERGKSRNDKQEQTDSCLRRTPYRAESRARPNPREAGRQDTRLTTVTDVLPTSRQGTSQTREQLCDQETLTVTNTLFGGPRPPRRSQNRVRIKPTRKANMHPKL